MKLLIAEDEILCMENLTEIPWGDIGVTLIDTARSGNEAFEKIKSNTPDIVLSDIEMEDGTGFDLAKKLTCTFPEIKVIFLTAYDKFEYAQTAIQYKAFGYVLKPINRKKLLETISEAKEKIEKENAERTRHKRLLSEFSTCKYFLKDYFLSLLASGKTNELYSIFSIGDKEYSYQTIVATTFNKNGISCNMDFRFFTDITSALDQSGFKIIPFYEQNMITYIVYSEFAVNNGKSIQNIFDAAEIISNYMKFHDTRSFTVAVGSAVNGEKMIPYCIRRAQEALKYHFSIGENSIIYIDDIEPESFTAPDLESLKAELIDCIKIGSAHRSNDIVHRMFASIHSSRISLDLAQRICLELVIAISIAMAQLGENPDILFNKTEIWSVMKNYHSISSLESFISDITDIAVSVINTRREEKNKDIIHRVKELIDENLETDVSLETIAGQVYVSSCYLSSLFKSKTGISYKTYITNAKLNHAKELLADTELPIYEIATKIGYKSPRHFSHIFQSQYGILPTEYRNMCRE